MLNALKSLIIKTTNYKLRNSEGKKKKNEGALKFLMAQKPTGNYI